MAGGTSSLSNYTTLEPALLIDWVRGLLIGDRGERVVSCVGVLRESVEYRVCSDWDLWGLVC